MQKTTSLGGGGAMNNHNTVPRLFWLCSIFVALGVVVSSTNAASKFPPAIEKLIPQAKAEGEVSLFTGSVKVTAQDAERFSRAMGDYYGFPIKVEMASLGSHPQSVQRLMQEAKAGVKPAVDVFNTAIQFLHALQQAGLIEAVPWKDLGVSERDIVGRLYAVDFQTLIRGVVYNTNLVKKSEAPRKFEDLLDKKWKGKIVAPALPTAFPYMTLVTGEELAFSLTKQLVEAQNLALTPTITDVTTRVATGEFLIGYGYTAGNEKKHGAPVENAPMKVGAFRQAAALLKNAQHPAAARLLVHFVAATAEGKKMIYEATNWAKYDNPGTEACEIAQGSGLIFAKDIGDEIEWETKDVPRMGKRFKELLGL
jgi:iron(III) transport system substrate-binding protein